MPEVRSGGVRISYDDVGRGEPALLLIPGWCTSRALFRKLMPRSAGRRRVLAVDLRGHGQSESPAADFGGHELVEDLRAVIEASGARQVVPVAVSHAGWLALELRRRLGERLPALVLLDWLVLEPPPEFLGALQGLQSPRWRQTRDALFGMWLHGVDSEELQRFIREDMGRFDQGMWARAGREISAAYAREGNPLQALSRLLPPVPTLHLYAQPEDPAWLAAQQSFAATHPWFQVSKLRGRSHFPTLELPDEVVAHLEPFVARLGQTHLLGEEAAPSPS